MMRRNGRNETMRRTTLMLALAGTMLAATLSVARAEEDDVARAARWKELQHTIFGSRALEDGSGFIKIDAPSRALDAALVPVGLTLTADKRVTGLYLVIDDNPSPLAAHFTFGPKADPHDLKLRVRIDQYTNMHAVVETGDGKLYEATRFIKAAGGCSAPAGADDVEALKDVGQMKLRLVGGFATDKPVEAALMVRHPNFNGMQMDQVTRNYTPARFIQSVDVAYNGGQVFHLDSDISLSTDPVITFGFVPGEKGTLTVTVKDSRNATWEHSFELPPADA
jgi:sulfur-oxidizing protein SoxY